MKKFYSLLALLLIFAMLLNGCGKDSKNGDPAKDHDTTDATTEPDTTEDIVIKTYTDVESLSSADGIISINQAEYSELSGVDLSSFPDEVREMYENIAKIVTYEVLYSVDDCTVSAFVSVPPDYKENNYPLVIYNRGGNGNFGANTAMNIATCSYCMDCVVVASNYREASPGTGKDEFGGADVNDVVFWLDIVNSFEFINREKIYMIGESRGGMQTCLAILEDSGDVISAAACVSGTYDLIDTYNKRSDMRSMLESRIGGTPAECPDEYIKRSAISFADKLDTPILLIHSTNDGQAPYEQAKAFASKLSENGKAYELVTREDSVHCISSPDEYKQIIEWLEENAE